MSEEAPGEGFWTLWSLDDAAGVPRGTCHRLRREGVLRDHCVRLGNAYYVVERDIPDLVTLVVKTLNPRDGDWISVQEASQLASRAPTTIYTLINRNKILGRTVGARVDVYRPSLERYIQRIAQR
jgi:hypothetical protein